MKAFQASAEINATPEKIWGILTDGSDYTKWDPNMLSLEGTIAPGERLVIRTKMSPDRAFNVTVSEFEPNKRMVWSSGMPLGLFKGARTFTLEPLGEGKTRFTTREEFSGPLLPLFGRMMPDLQPAFNDFVNGMKIQAEST